MTDVAGFTEIMRGNEPQTLPLLRSDMEVIRAHVARQGGEVVKVAGDGLLALFDSAPSAVKACIDAQDELAASSLKHRMAIHAGEVTVTEGDAYGDVVNVCARLEAVTTPGTVFASRIVIDLVRAQGLPTPFHQGKIQLKGLGNPLEIYSWGSGTSGKKRSRKKWILVSVTAVLLISVGTAAYFESKSPVISGKTKRGFGRTRKLLMAPMSYKLSPIEHSNNAPSDSNDPGNANNSDQSTDDLLDQAYDEVWQEMEELESKKAEAIAKVDATIVLQYLKSTAVGQREKGKLETEHWSLIEMAIEAGRASAGKNATADQIWSALSHRNDPDLELAKQAFAEEFHKSK